MTTTHNFPQYLGITGQSGAGKGSAIKVIREIYDENHISYELISNGPLFTAQSAEDTYFGKQMQSIHNNGLPQPLMVSIGTYYPLIKKALNEGKNIIHDGTPRQSGEATILAGLLNTGYCKSMEVLEVTADEYICKKRLWERTGIDKRADLSIEGQPGVPDMLKILNKMKWWSEYREVIISEIKSTRLTYSIFENMGMLEEQKEKLYRYFS